jgi:hypothetical protein
MMKVKQTTSLSVQLHSLLTFEDYCLSGLDFMWANKNLPSFQNLPPPVCRVEYFLVLLRCIEAASYADYVASLPRKQ